MYQIGIAHHFKVIRQHHGKDRKSPNEKQYAKHNIETCAKDSGKRTPPKTLIKR